MREALRERRARARRFRFPRDGDVRADIRDRYGYEGDLLEIYAGNRGAVVHKWHHYLPLYDRYFGAWRNKPVRFLEIGVAQGGSLQMWRRWFGDEAVLFGIDVNSECSAFNGLAAEVRIGSQADRGFLEAVVAEMGGIDLVLDDGSHRMEHIRASLEVLFPKLSSPGTYMIEDLHAAYLPQHGGGYGSEGNFYNDIRRLIDDMHAWYHPHPQRCPELARFLTGIHIHDSIVVLDKAESLPPTHSRVG